MKFLVPAVVVLAAALLFGARCMTIRNDLVAERQTIGADWTQVDATLANRAAIVPELTNLVRSEAPSGAPHRSPDNWPCFTCVGYPDSG